MAHFQISNKCVWHRFFQVNRTFNPQVCSEARKTRPRILELNTAITIQACRKRSRRTCSRFPCEIPMHFLRPGADTFGKTRNMNTLELSPSDDQSHLLFKIPHDSLSPSPTSYCGLSNDQRTFSSMLAPMAVRTHHKEAMASCHRS